MEANNEDLIKTLKGYLKKALYRNNVRTYIISTLQDPEFVTDHECNIIYTICAYSVSCIKIPYLRFGQLINEIARDLNNAYLDNIQLASICQSDIDTTDVFSPNVIETVDSFSIVFYFTTKVEDED